MCSLFEFYIKIIFDKQLLFLCIILKFAIFNRTAICKTLSFKLSIYKNALVGAIKENIIKINPRLWFFLSEKDNLAFFEM